MLKRILKNKVAVLSCLLGLAIGFYLSNFIPEGFAQKGLTPLSQTIQGSYTAIPILREYNGVSVTSAVMVISPTGHVWYVDTTGGQLNYQLFQAKTVGIVREDQLKESATSKKW